ncbi:glycerophosphoryl diester phosphodiesterase membrane domain-containing protein [Microbacterium yannicii]|uniref:glycerophosphoryl diester phosphodiesterase membrane domain-containing protein n=1 Tax=Microbacterium yannicii TaxID=671622 RepID=UPI0002D952DE|nr:DUF3824 domain-containing protein [Microbacterium yannicii]
MTAYPAWTPASRPGIIPLHPLTFGTILGRSFSALRQNPRVLLGFALIVQTLAYVVVLAAVLAISFASFSRLDTLRPGTEEFETVLAGSIAITAVAGLVLGLAAGALSIIVQAIVVVEVTHAAVAEKLSLGALWRQVKPIAWRLIGYSALVILAVLVLVAIVGLALAGIAIVAAPAAIALGVVIVLGAIPLTWWLMIKLLLVPATIIIERATIRQAISRSWTLTRGRFWPALGIIFLISMVFGAVAQLVGLPLSFLSMGLTTIIAPTGDPEPSAIIGILATALLTQVLTLLLQSVAIVVQSTATAIIYIDCRMRREGLDLDLLSYVERRDAGAADLADPYRQNVGREIAPRGWPAAAGYPPYPPSGQGPYPGQPPAQPPYPGQPSAGPHPYAGQQPPYAGQPLYAPPAAASQAAPPTPSPSPAASASAAATPAGREGSGSDAHGDPARPHADDDAATPAPTSWTAPGTSPDGADRESPWA